MDGLAANLDEKEWMGEVSCELLAMSCEPYAEYSGRK